MAKRVKRAGSGPRRSGAAPAGVAPQPQDDVRLLARDAALAALTRLAELANSEDERVALAASQELLNRAFGRSASAGTEESGGAAQPLVIKIVRFGAADPDAPCPPPAKGQE